MLLVVVSGGTAHGVGLEAPEAGVRAWWPAARWRALGGLEAAGRVAVARSTSGGKQRWFAEPPHMQVSMLLVPDDVEVTVGEQLDVRRAVHHDDVRPGRGVRDRLAAAGGRTPDRGRPEATASPDPPRPS